MSVLIKNGWPVQALGISFLIHLLLLNLFIFVVPVKPEPHKPVMVFFGALFNPGEISAAAIRGEHDDVLRPTSDIELPKTISPYDDRSVPKPSYKATIDIKHKPSPRVVDALEADTEGFEEVLDDLGIPAPVKYEPLRFQTK